jgi:hypothetical protein
MVHAVQLMTSDPDALKSASSATATTTAAAATDAVTTGGGAMPTPPTSPPQTASAAGDPDAVEVGGAAAVLAPSKLTSLSVSSPRKIAAQVGCGSDRNALFTDSAICIFCFHVSIMWIDRALGACSSPNNTITVPYNHRHSYFHVGILLHQLVLALPFWP